MTNNKRPRRKASPEPKTEEDRFWHELDRAYTARFGRLFDRDNITHSDVQFLDMLLNMSLAVRHNRGFSRMSDDNVVELMIEHIPKLILDKA